MNPKMIEKDDKVILDMEQNHSLANLLRKYIWKNGGEAGYDKGHPLGDESNLVINSDEPRKLLKDAVETAKQDFEDLESSL